MGTALISGLSGPCMQQKPQLQKALKPFPGRIQIHKSLFNVKWELASPLYDANSVNKCIEVTDGIKSAYTFHTA